MKRWRMVFLPALAFALMALFQGSLAETVTLPDGLTAVEAEAFFGDASLKAVVLPEGLKTIGSKAFAGTGLTSVDLPASLKSIADDAFDGPEKLSVTAEVNSRAYLWAVANGYIVPPFTWAENDDGTLTITGYTGEERAFYIPDVINHKTVTVIGEGAFKNNTSLTMPILPDTLKVIRAEAFSGCTGMYMPEFPFGLLEIGDRAFEGISCSFLSLPRTLVSIGEDAFAAPEVISTYVGSYADQWAASLVEENSGVRHSRLYIANVSASTKITVSGNPITFTARDVNEYVKIFQWQRSSDGVNWTDCEGEGADKAVYTFVVSPETYGCVYRAACTDISGTYCSKTVSFAYLDDYARINSAYVAGTNISLGWAGTGWEEVAYTLYMTGPDGTETVVAENIGENFHDVSGLEPETAYTFRLTASYGGESVSGVSVTVTTQNYRTGTVYRALLIGQADYGGKLRYCTESIGDLNLMGNMLQHVKGPQGGAYSVTRKTNLTADQVHQAIRTTFADADADDVSLFFIVGHGVDHKRHGEDYVGALICYNPSTNEEEYIKDTTLAAWLSEIPGEVVVILEACSSGSAIYDDGEGSDSLSAMNRAAISAFQSADQPLSLGGVRLTFDSEGNATQALSTLRSGALRQSKFHVITSSAHMERSIAIIGASIPHSLFVYGLTQGVGLSDSMPCDTNGDNIASMRELASYTDGFLDAYTPKVEQHVQSYPANSDYALFFRED